MSAERRHESEDLEDYDVLDSTDTLDGPPGDDPLDRGVAPPEHWSAAMRYGMTAGEQEEGESLDRLLAEEEPDVAADLDDDRAEESDWDENATEPDVARYTGDALTDPRAGRLVSAVTDAYEEGDAYLAVRDELVARDAGIDGGAATAEEAAIHVSDDEGEGDDEDDPSAWPS